MREKTLEISPSPESCRALRERLGWSAPHLAEAAGITNRTVQDFEAGLRAPRSLTLIAIRRAFRTAGVAVEADGGAPPCLRPEPYTALMPSGSPSLG